MISLAMAVVGQIMPWTSLNAPLTYLGPCIEDVGYDLAWLECLVEPFSSLSVCVEVGIVHAVGS